MAGWSVPRGPRQMRQDAVAQEQRPSIVRVEQIGPQPARSAEGVGGAGPTSAPLSLSTSLYGSLSARGLPKLVMAHYLWHTCHCEWLLVLTGCPAEPYGHALSPFHVCV